MTSSLLLFTSLFLVPITKSQVRSWCCLEDNTISYYFGGKQKTAFFLLWTTLSLFSTCTYWDTKLNIFFLFWWWWFVKTSGALYILSSILSANKNFRVIFKTIVLFFSPDSCADVTVFKIMVFFPEEKLYIWLPCVIRREIKCPRTREQHSETNVIRALPVIQKDDVGIH